MNPANVGLWAAIAFSLILTIGCSGGSAPVATPTDEISAYLDEHPELKEPKEDVGYSDPTKPSS